MFALCKADWRTGPHMALHAILDSGTTPSQGINRATTRQVAGTVGYRLQTAGPVYQVTSLLRFLPVFCLFFAPHFWNTFMQRRLFLQLVPAASIAAAMSSTARNSVAAATAAVSVDVYRTPSCGCCGEWITHLRRSGFTVNEHAVPDTAPYRARSGIPEMLASCHTGIVAGYALEGHVPASDIRRLLAEKPDAVGLAVPGMPLGSPGMEAPQAQPFDVLLVRRDGKHAVYRHYDGRTVSG